MAGYNPESIQEEVSEYWKENDTREKVRETTEGNEPFFLIDGPPYLNGSPHVGHMQGKVLKDVYLRFKQMQGYDVWDQAGFDTHGLPNELATEEELGIENKNEIGDSISAEKFINECRERATSAREDWTRVMNRLAIWQDFEDPYMTYDNDYIESAWWLVSQIEEQDLLYRAYKPLHWCPRCQTSLSGYEVTDEYQQVQDIAVFAKFPLENREEKVVIWTTTPWTIPSNMAVFVHPEYEYATVEVDGEKLIIAEQLVDHMMETAGYEEHDYEMIDTFPGTELEGEKYEHPFLRDMPKQHEMDGEKGVHRIHSSENLVSLEEGTGVVHAATGHGPEDYEETRRLELPVFSPLDGEGNYNQEAGEFEGENVLEVDPEIVDKLRDKGLLFHSEDYHHEYPHCWRCKTELIYRATEQWFIENEEVKQRMLDENGDVDWIPENAQRRFHNFVEESPDWCISRQNYWGIPIPIWVNDETGEIEVIGSFEELEEKAGELPEGFDPHKHVVDDITWEGEEGGTYHRVEDILDVWFDSGCAPFASLHYPFEEEPLESMWPMDFITEASDQIRGWFYSLMFCGILGFDEAPYEKILFQGYVLDAEGEKMSKSLGNVIDPERQVEKFGADLPRFYSLRVAAPWEQTNYDESTIKDEIYRLFSVYWNTKEFYQTYAEGETSRPDKLEIEDRWILSRLNSLEKQASERLDEGRTHEVTRELESFILEDLSRWYVKIVRDRVKKDDEAARWALGKIIEETNLMLAPFTPYLTEKIYQDLDGDRVSVHAERYPEPEEPAIEDGLEESMDVVRDIVENANKIRDEEQYNLRWPAKRLVVSVDDETESQLTEFEELLKEMANIRELEYGDVASELVAKPDYSSIGPKFGHDADKVARHIEELEHDQIEQLQQTGEIELDGHDVTLEDVDIRSETVEGIGSKSFEQGQIFLDLNMTDDIEGEAFVNEVIRAVQQERKEAGLDVEDRVRLNFSGDTSALEEFEQRVESRVKVAEITYGQTELENTGEVEFRDRSVRFSFSKPK